MCPAFAAQFKLPRVFGIKENYPFDTHASVFRATEADRVNARFPCHLCSTAPKRHHGIGKPGAVHMCGEPMRFGHFCERTQLFKAVNPPSFCHLWQGQRTSLGGMHISLRPPDDRRLKRLRRHLVLLTHQCELATPGIELRCVALIDMDMRKRRAKDRVPRPCERGESKRIGGRAGGDQIDGGLGRFELSPHQRAHLLHHLVVTIGRLETLIGLNHRVHHFR